MDGRSRIGLAAVLAAGALQAKAPRLPADAPFCARPGARQLFVAPMGEPFRAAGGQPYPAAQWFAQADRSRDGAVDRAEMVADARAFFTRLDRDGDGRLTPEEVAAYERDVAPEIALYAGRREPDPRDPDARRGEGDAGLASQLGFAVTRRQGPGYGAPLGAGRYAWLNIPEPVASADLDVDRLVSADEFAAAAGRRFDTLDGAHAGRITPADPRRTPQQMAIEGPCRPRPKPRRDEHHGPFDEPPAGGDPEGTPR